MKKLIALFFVLSACPAVFAVNKNVAYNKDTKEIIGVAIQTTAIKDTSRVNIKMENDVIIYGAKTDKILTIAIDEKSIPADIITTAYKIDIDKKEIYQEIKLGD